MSFSGLNLNRHKTKCYIHPTYRNTIYNNARGDITEGFIRTPNGRKEYGITCCGIPVGTPRFLQKILRQHGERIICTINNMSKKINPTQVVKPEMPRRQCLWQITLRILQHLGNYWVCHLPPDITEKIYKMVDRDVVDITMLTTQIDTNKLSDITKERMRLPVRFKGCGLHSLEDR